MGRLFIMEKGLRPTFENANAVKPGDVCFMTERSTRGIG